MRRRTLLQAALALGAALRVPGLRALSQEASFPGPRQDTLNELAATVLPASLGRERTDAVAAAFTLWVRGYRAGAAMSPGYGSPRIRFKGPSPAPRYQEQLAALATGALASTDLFERRRLLAAELDAAGVGDLSGVPGGTHVVTDLMSFYFSSPEAHDLAYGAAIGKNLCRTLDGSGRAPAPLGGGSSDGA